MLSDANDADILRAVGLKVLELPGWKERGETDGGFTPIGLMFHHDGMELSGDADPSNDLNVPQFMSQNGIDGSQKWVGRDGLWVMLAAGRKWHAGLGVGWKNVGRDEGNTKMDGLETDHTVPGNPRYQPWSALQLASINLGVGALCRARGWEFSQCCGHMEYTRDTGRKVDPEGIDLNAWRRTISQSISVLQSAYVTAGGTIPTIQGGFLMSLSDPEQKKLAEDLAWLRGQFDNPAALAAVHKLNHTTYGGLLADLSAKINRDINIDLGIGK